MIALRENEQLAVSVGIDVTRYLVLAAVVSAAMAGAAGSLYAHYIRIIDPDIFLFLYTVTMVIMVITGGKGTLAGPIVGGLIFGFVPGGRARSRRARGAVDSVRRADDRWSSSSCRRASCRPCSDSWQRTAPARASTSRGRGMTRCRAAHGRAHHA